MNHQHAETLPPLPGRKPIAYDHKNDRAEADGFIYGYTADQMRDYARAAIAALSGGGWLPIESAPKDGTVVLLCAPSWLSPGVGAYEDGHWLDCGFGYAPEPTHWQPLPTPLAAHAQAGEGSNG